MDYSQFAFLFVALVFGYASVTAMLLFAALMLRDRLERRHREQREALEGMQEQIDGLLRYLYSHS